MKKKIRVTLPESCLPEFLKSAAACGLWTYLVSQKDKTMLFKASGWPWQVKRFLSDFEVTILSKTS